MPVALVAAHPDDEAIGLGTALPQLGRPLLLIHVTDGAPRTEPQWQDYAATRRREVESALTFAGAKDASTLCLDYPDQEAIHHLAELTERLAEIFSDYRPSLVFTHAYEGGHPDHDATAAAVHAALASTHISAPLLEFASYHASPRGFECECFLGDCADAWPRPLSDEDRDWKRGLFNCYPSQANVLAQFPLSSEPIRLAPKYDFSRRAHEGKLYYENFNWGVRSDEWVRRANLAFRQIGTSCVC